MYSSLISVVVIITVFFIAKAVIGNFFPGLGIFSTRSCVCVVLGALLGGLIASPLFGVNRTLAYIGMGLGIGLMYVLFYSGIIHTLIQLIPANIRRFFVIAFNVIRVVAIILAIVGASYGVLTLIGV